MPTFRIGQLELNLELVGAGVRHGVLPQTERRYAWYLNLSEARDLEAFEAAGWRFRPEADLDWRTVPPDVLPRLRQYQIFRDEMKPEILSIEEAVENEALRYCGRLDRRIKIAGREGILDMKSPSRCAWHPLQLAMYAACFPRPLARWNLYLYDERYQLIEHKDRSDWEVCKAILTLYAWRQRNGHT